MTHSSTIQLWRRGAQPSGKTAQGFRKLLPAYRQWEVMKSLLNRLVINQRIGPISLIYAKELQQYAEELVFLASRCADQPVHRYNSLVESMLKSAEAREILYERLVPRYSLQPGLRTRIVNTWQFRDRDTTPLGFIEFVDRPGEFLAAPSRPTELVELGTRRERRLGMAGRRKERV